MAEAATDTAGRKVAGIVERAADGGGAASSTVKKEEYDRYEYVIC